MDRVYGPSPNGRVALTGICQVFLNATFRDPCFRQLDPEGTPCVVKAGSVFMCHHAFPIGSGR